jgi:predicted CoA-substrate-specific enzyme activase
MAGALGVTLDELNDFGLREGNATAISSVCTVFAESEVVSLIAGGTAAPEIARGIFQGITRRIEGMARRVGITEPITMTGGGALNAGLVKSLQSKFGSNITVPPNPQLVGALGAALLGIEASLLKTKTAER